MKIMKMAGTWNWNITVPPILKEKISTSPDQAPSTVRQLWLGRRRRHFESSGQSLPFAPSSASSSDPAGSLREWIRWLIDGLNQSKPRVGPLSGAGRRPVPHHWIKKGKGGRGWEQEGSGRWIGSQRDDRTGWKSSSRDERTGGKKRERRLGEQNRGGLGGSCASLSACQTLLPRVSRGEHIHATLPPQPISTLNWIQRKWQLHQRCFVK